MSVRDADARSREACPVCGQHRLTLLSFPEVSATGYQPYAEVIGMGEHRADTQPGIGCLACGAEWPDLAAFRATRPDGRRDAS